MTARPHEDPACRCEPCRDWIVSRVQALTEEALTDCVRVTSDANGNAIFHVPGYIRTVSIPVTVKPCVDVTPCPVKLDCGGSCHLPKNHAPPCLCVGDTDGPDSCPA